MLYVKNITATKNTAKQNYETTTIKVWKGVIHEIDIFIPSGHRGLAKLQIYHGNHIIMPTNEDGFVSGDNNTIQGRFFIDLKKEINLIEIRVWNDDDTYDHEFIIRIGVLPKFALLPIGATEGMLASLRALVIRPSIEKDGMGGI